jgi:nucleoside-diphosphate-sugar epimerase
MKIAITGHTQGIGKSLSLIYQRNGHDVIGFSRSNGFDISDQQSRTNIVKSVSECDVFINNAHGRPVDDFAQTELLFELWQTWQDQQKTIVNIGSSITMRWQHNADTTLSYRTGKRALEDACEFLWNKSAWPYVTLIAPCLTDTPRHVNNLNPIKVDPDKFAEMVYSSMNQTDFRVQVLKLAANPSK